MGCKQSSQIAPQDSFRGKLTGVRTTTRRVYVNGGQPPILTPSFPLPLLHITQAMTSSRRLLDKSMAKLEKVGLPAIVCRGRVCIQPLEVVLPHCSIYLHTHTRHGNGVAVVQFQSMAQVGGGYAVDPPEVRVQHATTV